MSEPPLLFVGDLHLGRRPTGLDAALEAAGLSARELSPAAGWAAIVDHALARGVRAVVLAGDVVEGERDLFEAYGHLERGARRLLDAGIPLYAVAGNHDVLVLPRLAERVPGFTLLGAGGRWELSSLEGGGRPVDLLGWSFPTPVVTESPLVLGGLDAALAQRGAQAALLGVLHADLDASKSRYAPVSRAALEAVPVDAWFLGHIHRPSDLCGPRPIGYLGSAVGLDVGEPGPRGSWEVHVDEAGVKAEHMTLAPVRFEHVRLTVDDEAAADADVLRLRVLDVVRAKVRALLETGGLAPRALIARVFLEGRVAHREGPRELARASDPTQVFFSEGVGCLVERVVDKTRPRVDLDELARDPSPLGRLAARVRALERGEAEALPWWPQALERLEPFSPERWDLPERAPDEAQAVLLDAAWRALDALLAGPGSGEG